MASGIERGDRVAVWAPNSLEWIVAALGVTTAGGVLVPINTRFKGAEAAYILARSRARALFTVRGFLDTDYPGAARERGRRAPLARTHDPALRAKPDDAAIGWGEFLATDRQCPTPTSTRVSSRSAPTIPATSCSRRERRGTRRAS